MTMATTRGELHDVLIMHRLIALGYSNAVIDQIVTLLEDSHKDVTARIAARMAQGLSTNDLEQLRAELSTVIDIGYTRAFDQLQTELTAFATVEAAASAEALDRVIRVDRLKAKVPPANVLRTLIETEPFGDSDYFAPLADWRRGVSDASQKRLDSAIRKAFVEGQPLNTTLQAVRGTRRAKYRDGILYISNRSAKRVVRTALTHTSAQIREATFQKNSAVVDYVEWSSTLDSRTSQQCAGLDGKRWRLGDKHPTPPAHPNCRSSIVPVTKTWRELGLDIDEPIVARASYRGEVEAVDFDTFMREQPRSFTESVFGKSKTKLLLDGQLPASDMLDSNFKIRNLDQLKTLYASAFEAAGL